VLLVDTGVIVAATDDALVVETLTHGDWVRVRALVRQYADLPLGGTDASMVALAERLGADRIATLDRRHFGVVRPDHAPALSLLP
jgi:predicted nucleic acid-binding protein